MNYEYTCPVCNRPAFYFEGKLPNHGDPIKSKGFRHLDGTPVELGERIICGSCGVLLNTMSVDRLIVKKEEETLHESR